MPGLAGQSPDYRGVKIVTGAWRPAPHEVSTCRSWMMEALHACVADCSVVKALSWLNGNKCHYMPY